MNSTIQNYVIVVQKHSVLEVPILFRRYTANLVAQKYSMFNSAIIGGSSECSKKGSSDEWAEFNTLST